MTSDCRVVKIVGLGNALWTSFENSRRFEMILGEKEKIGEKDYPPNRGEREVIFLENYIKAVLYAYPLLKTVGEDYAEHIKNKAVLSYYTPRGTEKLAEYLAEEILRKNCLLWLREAIASTLEKLSGLERLLIEIRYFGKKRNEALTYRGKDGVEKPWSERKYFRCQQRLGEKIGGMLTVAGLTKDWFEKNLLGVELIGKIYRYLEAGKPVLAEKWS